MSNAQSPRCEMDHFFPILSRAKVQAEIALPASASGEAISIRAWFCNWHAAGMKARVTSVGGTFRPVPQEG